jgi:hypothetical protein
MVFHLELNPKMRHILEDGTVRGYPGLPTLALQFERLSKFRYTCNLLRHSRSKHLAQIAQRFLQSSDSGGESLGEQFDSLILKCPQGLSKVLEEVAGVLKELKRSCVARNKSTRNTDHLFVCQRSKITYGNLRLDNLPMQQAHGKIPVAHAVIRTGVS